MNKPVPLPRFIIQPNEGWHHPYFVTATDRYAAWRTFCAQYFGHLKPARRDYSVRRYA